MNNVYNKLQTANGTLEVNASIQAEKALVDRFSSVKERVYHKYVKKQYLERQGQLGFRDSKHELRNTAAPFTQFVLAVNVVQQYFFILSLLPTAAPGFVQHYTLGMHTFHISTCRNDAWGCSGGTVPPLPPCRLWVRIHRGAWCFVKHLYEHN